MGKTVQFRRFRATQNRGKLARSFVLLLFVALTLSTSWSCSGANSGVAQRQGLRGTATLRILPGIPNVPPVVNPLPNAIIAVQPVGGGVEITRQTADASGKFEIPLPAGTYLVVPMLPEPNNSPVTSIAPPQTIVVLAGQFITINVEYMSAAP